MAMNCFAQEKYSLSAESADGTFDDSDVKEAVASLTREMKAMNLTKPMNNQKNAVLVWNLPPVFDVKLLKKEFVEECRQKIPDFSHISSTAKHRTDKEEQLKKHQNPNGNPNVLICSFMVLFVAQRNHLNKLMEIWDGQMFQGKKLRVTLSIYDGGDDQ